MTTTKATGAPSALDDAPDDRVRDDRVRDDRAPGDEAMLAAEAEAADRSLAGASAREVVSWAVGRFGDGLVVTTSFQDCVLVDLVCSVRRDAAFVFLDTGFNFPETLAYLRAVERRYDLHLEIVQSGLSPDEHPCGTPRCCELRKVAPLARVLEGRSAWVTGLKRVDTPERRDASVVAFDESRRVVKVNPLATWTEDDVDAYVVAHDLPAHPLNALGYLSIGCAPTTRPIEAGEDPRAGRWSGTTKTECGLHL